MGRKPFCDKRGETLNLEFLPEPDLEFGGGGKHIDVRFGLMQFGPLDRSATYSPSDIRVGIVGTSETIEGVREWLERGRAPIPGKKSRLPNLFPDFPGFSIDSCFESHIECDDRWCSPVGNKEIEGIISSEEASHLLDTAVDLFVESADQIVSRGAPSVIICAPPYELITALDYGQDRSRDITEEEIDDGSDSTKHKRQQGLPYFHDLLKAKAMRLGVPIQMVRPHTYSPRRIKVKKGRIKYEESVQDEATRAWNFHTALYYKAGGILWRLVRQSSELTACFVGISFYRTLTGDRVLTSVAQVFNERGEGIIVKGGEAEPDKFDKSPHLSEEAARSLLANAIGIYRGEHKASPARIVVHKTSRITEEEMAGFESAVKDEKVEWLDLLSVRRSYTRLFRTGTYPPLRGTLLKLDASTALLYLRGSVNFFQAYPGMYVPRPLEFSIYSSEATQLKLAQEIFGLSKLNWNNTQFDGGEPITVRAARRVGDILKCISEGGVFQHAYRYYM
jgi:hypothetical protein